MLEASIRGDGRQQGSELLLKNRSLGGFEFASAEFGPQECDDFTGL